MLNQKPQPYALITPAETFRRANEDSTLLLLDVRTAEEYNGELGHVANTLLIPVQDLDSRVDELERYKDRTVIAICRSGNRSGKAAAMLAQRGFSALNMAGGMIRWNEEQLPVTRDSTQ